MTSYRMTSFEDGVIFVHDVEHALEHLNAFSQQLVATIVFQDYTQDEAAEVLHCARRTVCRVSRSAGPNQRTFLGRWVAEPPADRCCGKFLSRGGRRRILVANKRNTFLQSMAQFPFQNAMLNLRVRKRARRKVRSFFVARSAQWPYAERSDRLRRGSLGSAPTDHGTGCTKRRFDGAAGV